MGEDWAGWGRLVSQSHTAVVLGVPIDDVTLGEAVDRIAAMVDTGRATRRIHQVATVNADFIVNAFEDTELRRILGRTDLSIPDGMIVVWATRLLGYPVRERTTGIDLLPALAERAADAGYRTVFFGGAPGVADRAATILRERHPGAAITAVEAPLVAPDGTMDVAALEKLRHAEPDIVCVALGNPKQEKWIARHGEAVGAPVYIGVGGSLDFLTGVTRRAPVRMQRSGLEWLHRTVSEPQRLTRRYARDFRVFVPQVVRQAWRGRRRGPAVAPSVDMTADSQLVIRLLGPAPAAALEPAVVQRLEAGAEVVVDVSPAGRLDNVTMSMLTSLVRTGRRHGAGVTFIGLDAVKQLPGMGLSAVTA